MQNRNRNRSQPPPTPPHLPHDVDNAATNATKGCPRAPVAVVRAVLCARRRAAQNPVCQTCARAWPRCCQQDPNPPSSPSKLCERLTMRKASRRDSANWLARYRRRATFCWSSLHLRAFAVARLSAQSWLVRLTAAAWHSKTHRCVRQTRTPTPAAPPLTRPGPRPSLFPTYTILPSTYFVSKQMASTDRSGSHTFASVLQGGPRYGSRALR